MQDWKPLEPLGVPSFTGDATGCKETFRCKEEPQFDSVPSAFEGLDTTTSLGDLDLIGQLFPLPSNESSEDAIPFPSGPNSNPQQAGPSTLPHSCSSGSSELPVHANEQGNDLGQDPDKPEAKTAQASTLQEKTWDRSSLLQSSPQHCCPGV